MYQSKELEPNITLQKVLDYFRVPVSELHRVGSEGKEVVLRGDDTPIPPGVYRLIPVISLSLSHFFFDHTLLLLLLLSSSSLFCDFLCFIETTTIFHFLYQVGNSNFSFSTKI
jgi:hypothetical protein